MDLQELAWNWAEENGEKEDALEVMYLLRVLETPGLSYLEMADAYGELERLAEKWNFTN